MTVKEYATDVNLSVAEILKKCDDLGIEVKSGDDELTDEEIISLDNAINLITEDESFEEEETIDEVVDAIVESSNMTKNINITDKKQKLKKKKDQETKDYSHLKKEMYKNKNKLNHKRESKLNQNTLKTNKLKLSSFKIKILMNCLNSPQFKLLNK